MIDKQVTRGRACEWVENVRLMLNMG